MTESRPISINKKGSRISILDVNGHLEIVPIVDLDELRKHDVAEIIKVMDDAHDQEMHLENGE